MQVREATTAAEREAVYRLRYEVYVSEMDRPQQYADHERQRIAEPLDDTGVVLYVSTGEKVVGTVRGNYSRDGSLREYELLYQMKRIASHPSDTSITTKFMVHPDHRGGRAALALATGIYCYALLHGIRFNVMDCNPPLVRFFESLGFKTFIPELEHEEYGSVVGMMLDLHDVEHFRAIRSPFLSHYEAWRSNQASKATA
ncbi:MAG: GNAT family N-acetyltransferase [Pseudomonadota bacterium]